MPSVSCLLEHFYNENYNAVCDRGDNAKDDYGTCDRKEVRADSQNMTLGFKLDRGG